MVSTTGKTIHRKNQLLFDVYFFANTMGNLLSYNDFEKLFFSPATILVEIFSLRLTVGSMVDLFDFIVPLFIHF
jgi:hypothetical protein